MRTRAPSRFFPASLKEGWKKFTNSRTRRIELRESRSGFKPLQTAIADDTPDYIAILLFDESLVILAVGAASRERDPGPWQ